ncbi:MAG: translation initiation factor IF-2 [Kiritimatiellaeota bacterium]|nr:translation initiation factor IF-2 [Kiritimatiellota bacterium]
MKLTELAKELGTTPRKLLLLSKETGLAISTYGSELRKKDEASLRNAHKPRTAAETAADDAAFNDALARKKAAAAERAAAKAAADTDILRETSRRAKAAVKGRAFSPKPPEPEHTETGRLGEPPPPSLPEPEAGGARSPNEPKTPEISAIPPPPPPPPEPAPEIPATPPPPKAVVGGMLPVRNLSAPRELIQNQPQPSKLVKKVTKEAQREAKKVVEKFIKDSAAAARAAESVTGGANRPGEPVTPAAPAEITPSPSLLTALPTRSASIGLPTGAGTQTAVIPPAPKKAPPGAAAKKPPRALHPLDEDEDNIAILPGKITRVVRTPAQQPGKGAPARPKPGGAPAPGARRDAPRGRGDPRDSRDARGRVLTPPPVSKVENGVLKLHANVLVKELADKLGIRPNVLITQLMKLGVLASINQSVDFATAARICSLNDVTAELEKSKRASERKTVIKNPEDDDEIPEDRTDQLRPRPPVVAFFGHVDHGKTSIMDRIRSASVAAGEVGGITQHISAYTVDAGGRLITFLDTPGHAAFTSMRARGATLTDIAVIIIAADDGIMEQTKEAIKHAREAGVTIMVAINKIDLPTANVMRVMQQLQAENLTPEDWGGDTVVCAISAATGEGIGNLLDMILLQSDVLELTANPDRRADGVVIEAEMKPGSGPAANILVTGGTLKVGDAVLCGEQYGKIRAIIDSTGRRVRTVAPSQAGTIMGLSGVPEAGAEFRVMLTEKRARELAAEYAEARKIEMLGAVTQARSLDDIFKKMRETEKIELSVVIRADVQGSVEAVTESIQSIKSAKVSVDIIQSGTGAITANDVQRASNAKAVVVGFNVSPESGVLAESRHYGIRIKTFRIIYELLDYIKNEMLDLIPVEYKEVVRGHATVRQVFNLGKVGVAAGSAVQDGVIITGAKARVMRKNKMVHSGDISTIRHYKDEVKEVNAGQECGILLADYTDYQEDDVIECFVFEELPKTL